MKINSLLLFLFIGLLTFSLSSCEKDEVAQEDNAATSSEDLTIIHDLISDVEDYVDTQVADQLQGGGIIEDRDNCATVDYENPQGTYPNTITVTFDGDCTGYNNRVRSGQMVITQSAPFNAANLTRTITLVDFTVDGVGFTGITTVVRDGENLQITRTVEDGGVNFPNGTSSSFESSHTLTQVEGAGTPNVYFDNAFEITGGTTGVNREGTPYESVITTPLLKRRNCRWVVSGVKTLTSNDFTRSIDYGAGDCDRRAMLTRANGETMEIVIFRRFW